MENRMKMGAAALTLAAVVSGCAPVPGTSPTTGSTTGYGKPVNGTTVATNTNTYDYGYGTTGTTNNANTSYDYYYGASTGYGTATNAYGSSGNTTYYDYTSPGSSTSSGYTYDYSAGSSSGSSAPVNNPTGGRYAVQAVASPNRSTADSMVSQLRGMGYNAVVDSVGGMYKVRVPFNSESEARNAMYNIRSSVPDAFYTTR